MKICIISGARPQFIKLAPIIHACISEGISFIHIHTGQHYDSEMSSNIFDDLNIPKPDFNLNIGSGDHGYQVGKMINEIYTRLVGIDITLVAGDTNSTISGAIASIKQGIPVVHLEAGLRSHDWKMPEEINRIVTDRVSSLFIVPTLQAKSNLITEGIDTKFILLAGDTMVDAIQYILEKNIQKLDFLPDSYILLTLHRQENVDFEENLENIIKIISQLPIEIVFPIHPRTKNMFVKFNLFNKLNQLSNLTLISPQSYKNMISILKHSKGVMTDSGGLQKEAFIMRKPCITLRNTTEWIETIELNANKVVALDQTKILKHVHEILNKSFTIEHTHPYGNGNSAKMIVLEIKRRFSEGMIKTSDNILRD